MGKTKQSKRKERKKLLYARDINYLRFPFLFLTIRFNDFKKKTKKKQNINVEKIIEMMNNAM